MRGVKYQAHQKAHQKAPQEIPKPAPWFRNQSTKSKETMMINGPPWLNSTLNFSRNKNNLKKCVKNNSKRRLKNNLISKCNKSVAKNNVNKNKVRNISGSSNSKPGYLIKGKDKKRKNIKEKSNSKRK